MTRNAVKTDFSRSLFTPRFLFCILLMFLVWEYNSKRFQYKEDILYLYIHTWGRSLTSLLAMVVASFAYSYSYVEDRKHHFLRCILTRISCHQYVFSKISTCFCTSFAVTLCGALLFVLRQSFLLPIAVPDGTAAANFAPMSCFRYLLLHHPLLFLLVQSLFCGLLCGGMSVLSMAFSAFMDNSYGVFILPFLLHYFFYFLLHPLAKLHDIFNVEFIYCCFVTYTKNVFFVTGYALLTTVLMLCAGYTILYKKIQGEMR